VVDCNIAPHSCSTLLLHTPISRMKQQFIYLKAEPSDARNYQSDELMEFQKNQVERGFGLLHRLWDLALIVCRTGEYATANDSNNFFELYISAHSRYHYLCSRPDSPEVAGFAVSKRHGLEAFHASSLNMSSINLCGSPTVSKSSLQLYISVQAPILSRAIPPVSLSSGTVPGFFVSSHPPLSSPCIACYHRCILI
jgi:hypothetical protein